MSETRSKIEKLVIATHNPGKLWEMRELLKPYNVEAVSAGDLGLPEPDETADTFIGNAELKALASARGANLPAMADDSGLCVDALGGGPGIYSARYAGPDRDFAGAMQRLEADIKATGAEPPYKAHFTSAISLAWPDGTTQSFEGKVFGTLVFPPKGGLGFGYDPIFLPDGLDKTFGEMWAVEKHSIPEDGSEALSHRARAFQAFAKACLGALKA